MHFLNFVLFENILIYFFFFKDIFAGYKILGFPGFLKSLEDVISLVSGFYFSLETSVVHLPIARLKVMFLFSGSQRWLTEKPNKTNTSTAKLIQKREIKNITLAIQKETYGSYDFKIRKRNVMKQL